jgi:hypothetical protein
MSAFDHLDRLNPVLVKEVRQAVRGKSFRGSFILVLTIAAVVSTGVLSGLDVDDPKELASSGTTLFFALHAVFLFCALVVVPVQANRSMASERDERTFDALIISGLSPAQIVFGKWLSAGVTQLIFLLALLPFFATAATLYGLDLLMAFVLTLFACFLGLTLSLLGILAATLSHSKAMASLLMMVFLAACGFAMIMMIGTISSITRFGFGGFGSSDEFLVIMGLMSAASFFTLFWLHGLAVATLSHPEENGMLRVRWAALSCALFLGLAPLILLSVVPVTPARFLFQLSAMSLMVLGVLNVPLLTESVGMRVRCRHELQSGRWRRPLAWLFLPGGGTAYVLFLLQILIVVLPTFVYLMLSARGTGGAAVQPSLFLDNGLGGVLTTLGVVLACAGLPAYFAARASTSLWLRNSLRFFILTLPFWIVIVLGIVELLFQVYGGGFLDSALNPFIAIDSNFGGIRMPEAILFWLALAGFGAVPMLMHTSRQRAEFRALRREAPDFTEPGAASPAEEPEA